jgi:hypothetical protein
VDDTTEHVSSSFERTHICGVVKGKKNTSELVHMDNVRLSIVHPTSEGGGSGRNKLKKNDNASTLRGKKSRGNKIKKHDREM